ncbi:MAG: sodium:proline symporter [Ignavibacteriae bacterium HGW-Ignavibacteriae-3]|nr:MAG: sodium:proline symporter [Ignavibacteriae bacterium HGW-Ignavibacteriae-3]
MIIVFVLYLAAVLVIAFISSRRAKTLSSFVLGDKKISGLSLALSERATGESAWLLLGLTGEAFLIGMQALWIALGCVIGIAFIWFVMGNRLRLETERTGALTVSSLLSRKFPGAERTIGTLSASIVVFFFTFYIAAQFSGGGLILHDTFGIDPVWGIIIGSIVVTFYCMIGGFMSVVATDVFQAVLMIFTLIVLPIVILFTAAANNIHIMETIQNADPVYSSLTADKTGAAAVLLIMSGMSWAFGYTGQPQLLTRMMAIKNERDVKTAKWVAIIWTLFAYSGAMIIGFAGFAFLKGGLLGAEEAKLAKDFEKILPVMINLMIAPVLAGFLLSGAISAMMSTASSEIILGSSSIVEDIYGNFSKRKITPEKSLYLNKVLTVAVGAVAFVLALSERDTVYGLVSYAWSGIGSSFGPALLLLLFWKKISRAGVIASLISGTVGTVIWKNWILIPTGVSERLGSFVFAFLLAVVFSLLIPEKKTAEHA